MKWKLLIFCAFVFPVLTALGEEEDDVIDESLLEDTGDVNDQEPAPGWVPMPDDPKQTDDTKKTDTASQTQTQTGGSGADIVAPSNGRKQPVAPLPQPDYDPFTVPRPVLNPDYRPRTGEDKTVVSQSRMFSVSGGDALRMGAIAGFADDTRKQLNTLLKLDGGWKYSVSIRLIGSPDDLPEVNPIRTRIRIIGSEPNFQIRIYPGGGINLQKFRDALITVVLYEYALRGTKPEEFPDRVGLPPWLITGIQQAILWRSGRVDRRLYRNLFERAEMLSPEDILDLGSPQDLDPATRQVYEVSCGVLMMSLLSKSSGADRLKGLLSEAATEEGTAREILMRYFHELGINKQALTEWWAVELATLSLPSATETLTPTESEKQLTEALTIILYDETTKTPKPVSADDLLSLQELPDWRQHAVACVGRLLRLQEKCFPGYRPIVQEYSRALQRLTKGADTDELIASLGPAKELRAAYMATMMRGKEFLDRFELSHMGYVNGTDVDAFMAAMRSLRREGEDNGPSTPISRYLDDIEALNALQEGKPLPKNILEQVRKNREHAKKQKK